MGLLDIWNEWKKNNQTYKSGFEDYTDTQGSGSLDTAGGGFEGIFNRSGESPFVKNPPFTKENFKKVGNKIINAIPSGDFDKKWAIEQANKNNIQSANKSAQASIPFHPSQGGTNQAQAQEMKWYEGLASKFNSKFDFSKAEAHWKKNGGFEGLMSNPAFTMGLAFMQAGAEGKTLGQGALDNVMKAAGISSHYKKILKDRKEAPIEVTSTDIGEVKSLLNTMNISSPSNLEKFWGFVKGERNMEMKWDLAAEEIAVELQKEIKKLQDNKKPGDPEVVYDTTKKLQILERMFKEGRFKKKGGTWFTDATLQTTYDIPKLENKAQGGPVEAGKPYIVGEKGPEVIIPKSDGNVLANDDSQIFAMLLASNPQLQNVSRQRAEKILRSRFPEYFEV